MPSAVSLSEVLAALSYALDLTEGQPAGHTLRACLVGMRLASELGLDPEQQSALYYALLLKDAGCSSNAARMASLFGTDDRVVKPALKTVDWHHALVLAFRTAQVTGRGDGTRGTLADRARHFWRVARGGEVTRQLIQVRCERGAGIARRIGFPEATCGAIRSLDEHWCGLGHPEGLEGAEIPLLARIVNIAQTVEAFHHDHGLARAMRVVRERRGRWFDPTLADLVLGWRWRGDAGWWRALEGPDVEARVRAAEPPDRVRNVDDAGLDEIAFAFAEIIDAKSPYTYQHSARVAQYAEWLGARAGMEGAELQRLRRAALLHDIGKLGVSNRVLDKEGRLDGDEWAQVRRHPMYTQEILQRVRAFAGFARDAALHHEKLDGTGYPWGVGAGELSPAARILCVADIYDALTSDRPYRAALTHEAAMAILREEAGAKLDAAVVREMGARAGAPQRTTTGVESSPQEV
ncbi:MAG TPA: HD domain-containing phosphohydrolase [Gemmatimonadaceae bacterium]